jgi:hypothetical protein
VLANQGSSSGVWQMGDIHRQVQCQVSRALTLKHFRSVHSSVAESVSQPALGASSSSASFLQHPVIDQLPAIPCSNLAHSSVMRGLA